MRGESPSTETVPLNNKVAASVPSASRDEARRGVGVVPTETATLRVIAGTCSICVSFVEVR